MPAHAAIAAARSWLRTGLPLWPGLRGAEMETLAAYVQIVRHATRPAHCVGAQECVRRTSHRPAHQVSGPVDGPPPPPPARSLQFMGRGNGPGTHSAPSGAERWARVSASVKRKPQYCELRAGPRAAPQRTKNHRKLGLISIMATVSTLLASLVMGQPTCEASGRTHTPAAADRPVPHAVMSHLACLRAALCRRHVSSRRHIRASKSIDA